MNYAHSFTDDELVEALKAVAAKGVRREDAVDRVGPPNLCAFLNNIPIPERNRLLDIVYPRSRS